jgi:hypothetical protein
MSSSSSGIPRMATLSPLQSSWHLESQQEIDSRPSTPIQDLAQSRMDTSAKCIKYVEQMELRCNHAHTNNHLSLTCFLFRSMHLRQLQELEQSLPDVVPGLASQPSVTFQMLLFASLLHAVYRPQDPERVLLLIIEHENLGFLQRQHEDFLQQPPTHHWVEAP